MAQDSCFDESDDMDSVESVEDEPVPAEPVPAANVRKAGQFAPTTARAKIVMAMTKGDSETAFHILEKTKNVDINSKIDKDGNTILMRAVRMNEAAIFQQALTAPGVDVNRRNNEGKTAVFIAVEMRGREKLLSNLLEHKDIDPNILAYNHESPLSHAFRHQKVPAIDSLLACPSINVNQKHLNDETVLMHLVGKYHGPTIQKLLDHPKIDINAKNSNDETVLILAAGANDYRFVKRLVAADADINIQSQGGETALMEVGNLTLTHRNASKFDAMLKTMRALLKAEHLDINIEDDEGNSVLRRTIEADDDFAFSILLSQKDIIVDERTKNEWLHSREPDNVKTHLLQQHEALSKAQIVILHKNDPSYPADELMRVLDAAVCLDRKDIVKKLADSPILKSPDLHPAVQLAIDKAYAHDYHYTFLMKMVVGGQKAMLKLLLKIPCIQNNLNQQVRTRKIDDAGDHEKGCTCLMLAVKHNKPEIVKMLLENEHVEIDKVDDKGRTALMHSVYCGDATIVQALLAHDKINPKFMNNSGRTAIDMAVQGYRRQVNDGRKVCLDVLKELIVFMDLQDKTKVEFEIFKDSVEQVAGQNQRVSLRTSRENPLANLVQLDDIDSAKLLVAGINKNVSVSFDGERGVDVGGLKRDWVTAVSNAFVAGGYLQGFKGDSKFYPMPVPQKNRPLTDDDFNDFRLFGKFSAIAFLLEAPLTFNFCSIFYKYILQGDEAFNAIDINELVDFGKISGVTTFKKGDKIEFLKGHELGNSNVPQYGVIMARKKSGHYTVRPLIENVYADDEKGKAVLHKGIDPKYFTIATPSGEVYAPPTNLEYIQHNNEAVYQGLNQSGPDVMNIPTMEESVEMKDGSTQSVNLLTDEILVSSNQRKINVGMFDASEYFNEDYELIGENVHKLNQKIIAHNNEVAKSIGQDEVPFEDVVETKISDFETLLNHLHRDVAESQVWLRLMSGDHKCVLTNHLDNRGNEEMPGQGMQFLCPTPEKEYRLAITDGFFFFEEGNDFDILQPQADGWAGNMELGDEVVFSEYQFFHKTTSNLADYNQEIQRRQRTYFIDHHKFCKKQRRDTINANIESYSDVVKCNEKKLKDYFEAADEWEVRTLMPL